MAYPKGQQTIENFQNIPTKKVILGIDLSGTYKKETLYFLKLRSKVWWHGGSAISVIILNTFILILSSKSCQPHIASPQTSS